MKTKFVWDGKPETIGHGYDYKRAAGWFAAGRLKALLKNDVDTCLEKLRFMGFYADKGNFNTTIVAKKGRIKLKLRFCNNYNKGILYYDRDVMDVQTRNKYARFTDVGW